MKRWHGGVLAFAGLVVGATGGVVVTEALEEDSAPVLSDPEYDRVVRVCRSNVPDATLGDCVAIVDDIVADIELDGADCDWRAVLSAVEAMTGRAMEASTDELYDELVEEEVTADGYGACFDTLDVSPWS